MFPEPVGPEIFDYTYIDYSAMENTDITDKNQIP
jgi:hypothetical protein